MMIINLKAYEEGIGKNALELAKKAEKVSKETGVKICVAPQPTDIRLISENAEIEIYAQHADAVDFGSHTGSVHMKAIKDAGAAGTIINHSEKTLRVWEVERAVELAKKFGLKAVVCANSPEVARAVACFEPFAVAVEPPELIGGNVSVSKARPEVVINTVRAIRSVDRASKIKILCGAGVKNSEDVRKAVELGAQGILVASGVVKAKDKEKAIRELAEGFI